MPLLSVQQYASHLYGNLFEKALGVGVSGMFLLVGRGVQSCELKENQFFRIFEILFAACVNKLGLQDHFVGILG